MSYPDVLLKKGAVNPNLVHTLKERLNALGFGPLDPQSPVFGVTTETAVKAFQKKYLLSQDGEVGPLTWHRLFTERVPVIEAATNLSGVALEFALSQLYVREKTGRNDGLEVEEYLRSVGLGRGYAWCVAFQYWCLDKAAKKLGVLNPMIKTAGVYDLWNRTPKENKFSQPRKGDLGVMLFGHGAGHLFRVKKEHGSSIITVEGNTAADPTSAAEDREGQGVFERIRKVSSPLIKGYIRYDL